MNNAMRSVPLGLDDHRYRLSRNSRGLGLHWQHPPARVAKIQSVAQGKIHPSYSSLAALALGLLVFFIAVGGWGIRRMVKEFHQEYVSQEVGAAPLTEAEKQLVPQVITRKEYDKRLKRKNTKKPRSLYQH